MKVLKEYVAFVHYIAGGFALLLTAGLLPGDSFNENTKGAVMLIVLLGIADAVLTVPAYRIARRRGVSLRLRRN